MKSFISIALLVLCSGAGATHRLTYYVYYETSYAQGPWSRTGILDHSDYRYLKAEAYEDLFGTVREELVLKMLSRLKEKKPDLYSWDYELTLEGNVVTLTTTDNISNLETVKNEVTAQQFYRGELPTSRSPGNLELKRPDPALF